MARSRTSYLSITMIAALCIRAEWRCAYCRIDLSKQFGESLSRWRRKWTIDHFIPRCVIDENKISLSDEENLLLCCVKCNIDKADYLPLCSGPVLCSDLNRIKFELGSPVILNRDARMLGEEIYPWQRMRRLRARQKRT